MKALRKVLVVDDDPVVGKSFDRVLAGKGYSVISVHDAAEALERMRQAEYDLVVTDIKMPGMDGLELAETLHARRPWTPVLIVTGYGTESDEARAKAAGVSAFLHKPLSPETIEGSTEAALHAAPEVAAAPAPAAAEAPAPVRGESRLRDIALFAAAPFIGLAYAVLMPFVGLAMLAWIAGKEIARRAAREGGGTLKFIGMALGTPLLGLAYAVLLPFAGLATLAWLGGRSLIAAARKAE